MNSQFIMISDNGKVVKFVYYPIDDETSRYHLVEERQVFSEKAIQEVEMIDNGSGEKYLLLNTMSEISRIPLVECSSYTNCIQCFQEGIPYCYWQTSSQQCDDYSTL